MNGAIVQYKVRVGCFVVNVSMLNVDGLSKRSYRRVLGNGSFGCVLEHGVNTILKRVYFIEKMSILRKAYDQMDWGLKANH